MMTDSMKWEAIRSCDESYDGRFFYAVRTTMIYCRPSCKSRTPVRANVGFFTDGRAAEEAGYRPCKRCRPDLLEPPGDEVVVSSAIAALERSYAAEMTLDGLAREVGMSKFHLQRLFKLSVGVSPAAYVTELRMAKAAELLANTALSVTRIALDTGYRSVSHFTAKFRLRFGCSPTDFRAGRSGGEAGA